MVTVGLLVGLFSFLATFVSSITITGIDPTTVLATAGDIVTAFVPILLLAFGIGAGMKLLQGAAQLV